MKELSVMLVSMCIGIDIANYANHHKTGDWVLNMDNWFNSPIVSVLNVVIVIFLLVILNKEKGNG